MSPPNSGKTSSTSGKTSTIAGFASATQPVTDSTVITTEPAGLLTGDVLIPLGDAMLPAYRAAPLEGGPHPIMLVVQEIFGVHEHIRDIARRFAKLGYLAIAPELYFRQGDPSGIASIDEVLARIVSKVPDRQVLSDLDATLAWVETHGGNAKRVGITGFCWGGRITWLYAAHQPKVRAAVAWYGKLTGATTPLNPKYPLDVAGALKAPVLGLYGGQDQGIPLESVERMRAELSRNGGRSQIHVYPDAPHAFYADYRPSYRRAAAEDGWARMRTWFTDHGV